ncbi:hypothetical protein [Devosia sediminis]|uniref:Uncharacterized protein n=1 Tax=Devosia sediminis TaxID=2798801 RepID=A0A934IS24_9HYPH|nr:hypothetical protein [Devosia sediminis]MBJ3785753.1 hypothetical protein [Devosia sediminis]
MRKRLLVAGLALIATPALAALPPHYQRQNELEAIIAHVVEEFGISHPIEAIITTDTDFYEVISGSCRMEVVIVDVPLGLGEQPASGPRRFAVESGPLVCDE